jgi:hypothetical protein
MRAAQPHVLFRSASLYFLSFSSHLTASGAATRTCLVCWRRYGGCEGEECLVVLRELPDGRPLHEQFVEEGQRVVCHERGALSQSHACVHSSGTAAVKL